MPEWCTNRLTIVRMTGAILIAAAVAACGQKPADARTPTGSDTDGKSANGAAPGGPARKGRTVVLAATDVGTVQRQSISEGVAITGTLRPIETIDIRARLEGNLEGVYVREGQRVSPGQLLARFESVTQRGNAASAEAQRAAAEADLATAKWNREQSEELFKAGAVAENDFRAAKQAEAAAQAKVAAADAIVKASSLSTRDTRVIAPASGVIDKRLVEPGEHLSAGAAMFTLVRARTLELAATVPERRASSIVVGQRVTIAADGRNIEGKVARINPTVDPASRTVMVYVDVPNPGEQLKGNAFASGAILSKTVASTLVIPLSALRRNADGSRQFVYRVNTGAVQEVTVSTGILDDRNGLVQITDGLSAGDQLVTGNLGTLTDGAKVQIIGSEKARPRR